MAANRQVVPVIGQTLGHYRILEKIGAGGMGEVYRARDTKLAREVAIKVLLADSSTDFAARARLLREAQAASALNHPHICTIYEIGEAEGQTYVAMEHVEGRPLNESIPSDGLPIESVLRYGAQIADALAHAHDHNIIHGDLKSANLVITPGGHVKVLDFGLAKRLPEKELEEATHSQASLTEAGGVVGTLAYMAPEMLRGRPADALSDLWAFGVTLYEMVTGLRPFHGQTGFDLSSAILRETPAPLPSRVPPSLRAVILRCLAKEPGQRYQRASEVRAALETMQLEGAVVPERRWRPLPGWWPAGLSATALVTLLAVALALNIGGVRERLFGRPGPPRIESLAVLPLENLSHDPEQEYFAEGMTEALITDLAQIRALRVISRTSVMRYKKTEKPLPEVARELNVDAVVEGSVQRAGDQVLITAQLVHAPTDTHLWAKSYQRDIRDVLALQNEVAQAIAQEIRITLTPQEQRQLASARPVNPAAHEAYLRGRYHANRFTIEGFQKSLEYFEQAVALDPSYAPAYAGLADIYQTMAFVGTSPPEELYAKAKQATEKALALDDTSAEAHAVLGWTRLVYDWDWSGAEREFRRALELNPSSTTALFNYSVLLSALGRHKEALALAQRGQELDPLSPLMIVNVGWRYLTARQYDKAIEQFWKGLEFDPNMAVVRSNLASAYLRKGMPAEAIKEFEASVKVEQAPVTSMQLAQAYIQVGRRPEALRILGELKERARRGYISPYAIAAIHAALGEKDQAFAWFEQAYESRDSRLIFLPGDPLLDGLHPDPRFQALLRRMNFPE